MARAEPGLLDALGEHGVTLAQIYHCPHHPGGQVAEYRRDCDCRKPGIGMIEQALNDFDIDMANSLLVGDKPSDIEAGIAAGVGRRFLVRCNGEGERPAHGQADASFDDLAHCVASLAVAARDRVPG